MHYSFAKKVQTFIEEKWDKEIIPTLMEYIKIPNLSPLFDKNWEENGHMDKAMHLIAQWCKDQNLQNMHLQILRAPKRTPLLYIQIKSEHPKKVLLYGHMDKQPEMSGWLPDLGPFKPVIKEDKLYGRGSADDGYAIFCAITAIKALQEKNLPYPNCHILLEASEESGSPDLPFYLESLTKEMGTPDLIICLDSSTLDYDQFTLTTSLRGYIGGKLTIQVLTEGVHSGLGSGVVPSTTNILRELLDRIEDAHTGEILLNALKVEIPQHVLNEIQNTAKNLSHNFFKTYPFFKDTQPITADVQQALINRGWKAFLSVTGIDGLPLTAQAGNVTIPKLSVQLSLRLPPTIDAKEAQKHLTETLEKNPPHGAFVEFKCLTADTGWYAPQRAEWLETICQNAAKEFFNKPVAHLGEGGTIPFMSMLGKMFPQTQFVITGVLGPHSNAHGPNEFLHIPMAKKLSGVIAHILFSCCISQKLQ